MLTDFEKSVSKEENDKVDSLRYSFEQLLSKSVSKIILCKPFNIRYINP